MCCQQLWLLGIVELFAKGSHAGKKLLVKREVPVESMTASSKQLTVEPSLVLPKAAIVTFDYLISLVPS